VDFYRIHSASIAETWAICSPERTRHRWPRIYYKALEHSPRSTFLTKKSKRADYSWNKGILFGNTYSSPNIRPKTMKAGGKLTTDGSWQWKFRRISHCIILQISCLVLRSSVDRTWNNWHNVAGLENLRRLSMGLGWSSRIVEPWPSQAGMCWLRSWAVSFILRAPYIICLQDSTYRKCLTSLLPSRHIESCQLNYKVDKTKEVNLILALEPGIEGDIWSNFRTLDLIMNKKHKEASSGHCPGRRPRKDEVWSQFQSSKGITETSTRGSSEHLSPSRIVDTPRSPTWLDEEDSTLNNKSKFDNRNDFSQTCILLNANAKINKKSTPRNSKP